MQERYILYGAGWEAECFYYQFKEKHKIDFVIDAKREGDFHGLKIYRLEDAQRYLHGHKVIIAVQETALYIRIKNLLEEIGHHDYMWSQALYEDERKVVIIHANCHRYAYKEFLQTNDYFCKNYRVVDTPLVHMYTQKEYRGGVYQMNC